MVRSFEEEIKALEDYGHDCCARIDDRIHECCARIREAHESEVGNYQIALRWNEDQQSIMIHLLGGDLKESDDGVDAGGRDEAGSVGTDASSPQCACSGRCGGLAEEVAPITTELREHLAVFKPTNAGDTIVLSRIEKAMQLCDAIDAVHANLERELKLANADAKTQRNNFDQATSAREHWKKLYEQSLEQIHDLEHDVEMWRDRAEDMRMERDDALKEHHEWAPESHYMMLPKDADGVPIHIGDVMESKGSDLLFGEASFEVRSMRSDECGWEVYDRLGDRYAPSLLRHHHAPTVEDVLREFALAVCKDDALTIRKGVVEEFAKRLTLAGDAE